MEDEWLASCNLQNRKPSDPTRFREFDFRDENPGMRCSGEFGHCVWGRGKPEIQRLPARVGRLCIGRWERQRQTAVAQAPDPLALRGLIHPRVWWSDL